MKPSTETKTKNAKFIIEAYPELVSVDENCPEVRIFLFRVFFVNFCYWLPFFLVVVLQTLLQGKFGWGH